MNLNARLLAGAHWAAVLLAFAWRSTQAASPEAPSGAAPTPDPRQGEVPLLSTNGWQAYLVLDNGGVGVWTVEAFQIFPEFGCPEVVGLDDLGRAHLCVSYSGKWTPTMVISDGKWLGGLAHGDIDPRTPGAETYAGSQQGNLYQIVAWPHGVLDYRLIAHLPGREIHTIVAGDIDAASQGPELIVFTRPGGLYRVTPTGSHGTFETQHLQEYPGRVRQALVLPHREGEVPAIATVSRNGKLELLHLSQTGPQWRTIYEQAMGLGRLARRPQRRDQPLVLYSTHDDGRILRHQQGNRDDWQTEVIYHGPQGPRGIAAGYFDENHQVETIAIFGYSKKVELLSRRGDGWQVETLFEDRDKGHWLAAAELDGRNNTHELLATGYSGRIVLLTRPTGYGRKELSSANAPH